MNSKILKKCLDELNKDSFRKDYVIGILETLVGEDETYKPNIEYPVLGKSEAELMDEQAKIKLAAVKQLTKYD